MCWRSILSDAKKIEAVIARLASEHDGEVIAAARALKRMAEAKGKKLWEFVGVVSRQSAGQAEDLRKKQEKEWAERDARWHADVERRKREQQKQDARWREDVERRRREQQKQEDEIRRMYEDMVKKSSRSSADEKDDQHERDRALEGLKRDWAHKACNWEPLRSKMAEHIANKGSESLNPDEKLFMFNIFQVFEVSREQMFVIKQIAEKLFGKG